ncbi:condensation domain-containing protein [Nocardia brasiliensis]|uniref:condensation domain-containing protein n=1 Tax=Nocardia brasiliensis TaxID=37326 RepID=UPI00142DA599|nr:condensation domain-containing protein [Nocardia brasiliensis]
MSTAAAGGTRLPLTPGQHLLDFLESIRPGGAAAAFNIAFRLTVDGPLDRRRLFDALTRTVERHEALRTALVRGRGMSEQVICADAVPEITVLALPMAAAEVAALLVEHNNTPFDLARAPLLRALLLEDPPRDRRLLQVTVHHSVADAWSLEVLKRDIGRYYRAADGSAPDPAPPPVGYRQLVLDELAALESQEAAAARGFWPEYLGALEVLQISAKNAEVASDQPAVTSRGDRALTTAQTARLRTMAARLRATPFMVLAAAYGFVLGHLCGCAAYLMPTFGHGRRDPRLRESVAMLFNPFVIRFSWSPEQTFADLVASFKRNSLSAYRFQWYPFIEVLELCQDLSVSLVDPGSALFPVQMLNVPKTPTGTALFGPDCVAAEYAVRHTAVGNVLPIDGLLTVKGSDAAMSMTFNAAQRLWNDRLAASMCASVLGVCLAAAQDSEVTLRHLTRIVDGHFGGNGWSI